MPIKFPELKKKRVEPLKVEESVWWTFCLKHCPEHGVDPRRMCEEMHHLTPLKPVDRKEYETILKKLKNSKKKGDVFAVCHFLYLASMGAYTNATSKELQFYLNERAKLMSQNGFLGATFDVIRENPEVSFKIANEYYRKLSGKT